MNVTVWQTLVGVAVVFSIDAYWLKREPLSSGLVAAGAWLFAGFGALSIETPVQGPDVVVQPEYAVAILCLLPAILAVVVVIKDAAGAYDQQDDLASTTGPASTDQLRP